MIALGIDPGTRHLGWGVVARHGNRISHVDHGVIDLDARLSLPLRLKLIEERLDEVLARHRPAVGSVETLFFHKDAQAAAKLGHARGVVLLLLARAGIDVVEYAPAKVKRTIAGRGRADKRQIQLMIRALLALDELPRPDAADALALAITHLRLGPMAEKLASRQSPRPRTASNPALAALLGRRGGRKMGGAGRAR